MKYNIIEVLNAPAGTKFKGNDGTLVEVKQYLGIETKYLIDNYEEEIPLNSYVANLEFEEYSEGE